MVSRPPRVILVPTDFSDPARRALDEAVWIASAVDAKLLLLHAVEPVLPTDGVETTGAVLSRVLAESQEGAKTRMDDLVKELAAEGTTVSPILETGSAVDVILKVATTHGADLVVVGTRGHTGVRRFLIGSVAHAVADRIHVPLLLVHGAQAKSDRSER